MSVMLYRLCEFSFPNVGMQIKIRLISWAGRGRRGTGTPNLEIFKSLAAGSPCRSCDATQKKSQRTHPSGMVMCSRYKVTDCKQSTTEVRVLASAGNSGKAFDLRCEVREKLLAFLRDNHPEALPQIRQLQRRADGSQAANISDE
jgi:hypothetical protein